MLARAGPRAREVDRRRAAGDTRPRRFLELAPKLLNAGVRVIDLSGAFRLRDLTLYPRFYGFTHPSPQLNAEAVYGLPELGREKQRAARLVANPGCYATAAALSVAPLVKAGLVKDLVITEASGVSGAGRKATEEFSFMELSQDFRAYKVLKHQHTPEISQTLGGAKVVFTPHLLPLQRGILSTTVATLTSETNIEAVLHDERYAQRAADAGYCRTPKAVHPSRPRRNTNLQVLIGVALDGTTPSSSSPRSTTCSKALPVRQCRT